MKKIVTLFHCNSLGLGGVENLIRDIQSISTSKNYKTIELYHEEAIESVSEQIPDVDMIKIENKFCGLFKPISKRLSTKFHINSINLNANDILVIFHPESLLEVPKTILSKVKVIWVQTNKLSVLCKRFGLLSLKLRGKYINNVIVYTQSDKNKFQTELGFLHPSFNTIPRACRLEKGKSKKSFSKKMVSICRIEEKQKNLSEMVSIAGELKDGVTLDIYGPGSDEEVMSLKQVISLYDNVRYCGATNNIKEVLSNYDVFIMTSYYEGFGQTLIEARSQGLPIIAYDTFDALRWIVIDGLNGEIVPWRDKASFQQSIQKVFSSTSYFSSLSEGAIRKSEDTEKRKVNKLWIDILTT